MKFKALGLLLAGLTLAVCAAPREDVDLTVWRINGIEVTATADQLNTLGTAGNIALANLTNALTTGTLAANLTGNIAGARMTNALATDGLNVPLERMTNALVTGTLAANLTGNVAGASLTNALATDGLNIPIARLTNAMATTIAGAAAGATALQPGVCAVTATTDAGVATVVVSNSLASQTVMCGWLSTNAGGFATAVNLTSIAVDGNSLLYTAADNPSPIFRTHTDGKTTFTITFSGASTNCFNVVQRDGAIKSSGSILPEP